MKLLVRLGATGKVGRLVLVRALQEGNAVTAFIHHPEKLQIQHPNLVPYRG